MSTQSVTYTSCNKILCGTLPAPVILCIPSSIVALHECPAPYSGADAGEQTTEYSYIEGSIGLESLVAGGCNKRYYEYVITYDDSQLIEGSVLSGEQIEDVIVRGCLTSYIDQKVGDEPYIHIDENGQSVFVSPHGCEYILPLGTYGTNTILGEDVTPPTGDHNVLIGLQAGFSGIESNANVGIGWQALYNLSTGNTNTAVGSQAGYDITIGVNNTLLGNRAGAAITTSSNNTAIGGGTMDSLTTGNDNVAVGKNALQELVTGSYNTAVGYGAGWFGIGNGNTYLGREAGPSSTTFEQDELYINDEAGFPLIGGNCFDGYIKFKVPTTAPADAKLVAKSMTIYLDEGTTSIKFKLKNSAGVVKTGTLAYV